MYNIDKFFLTAWFCIDATISSVCFFSSCELYQTSFVVMSSRLLALNCKHSCIWHNLTHISRQNQWGTRGSERGNEPSNEAMWSNGDGNWYHHRRTQYIIPDVMCMYIYTHYCISIMETYWIICFMSNITPMLNVQYILTHIRAPYTVWDYSL